MRRTEQGTFQHSEFHGQCEPLVDAISTAIYDELYWYETAVFAETQLAMERNLTYREMHEIESDMADATVPLDSRMS